MIKKLLWLSLFCVYIFANTSVYAISTENLPRVRMVYFIPSDKFFNFSYKTGMENAILNIQDFYLKQLGNGKTFFTHQNIVDVVYTDHPADWYASDMWGRVISDANKYLGAKFNDPNNIWMLYIDSDPNCGVSTGGSSGIAVFPANDLRGLVGEATVPPCEETSWNAHEPVNRWIGGLGHELGHAFSLSHPPGCESDSPASVCSTDALMWTGYSIFPNTFLTELDKITLNDNTLFITEKPTADSVFDYAEREYSFLFNSNQQSTFSFPYYYRYYGNGVSLLEWNGKLWYSVDYNWHAVGSIMDFFISYVNVMNPDAAEYVDGIHNIISWK